MDIFTVVIQGIQTDATHRNGIETFDSFEKAKQFIDHCVETQKSLEGKDSFIVRDLTGERGLYGWLFSGEILYGVETENISGMEHFRGFKARRFIIKTNLQ